MFYYGSFENTGYGGTGYNFENNRMNIEVVAGDLGSYIQEGHHGAGFLRNEWTIYTFINSKEKKSLAYDAMDEIRAYELEYVFSPADFWERHPAKSIKGYVNQHYVLRGLIFDQNSINNIINIIYFI